MSAFAGLPGGSGHGPSPHVVVAGPTGVFAALRHDREAAIGFRPTRVAGDAAAEIVGPEDVIQGYYAALHAALSHGEQTRRGAARRPDAAGDPPTSVLLRLDRGPSGLPRVRVAEDTQDDLRLLSQAERVAAVGSWELLVPSGRMRWSENLFRICGLEPDAITPSLDGAFRALHPEDRPRAALDVEGLRERGELPYPVTHRIVLPSGELRHLRFTLGLAETGPDGGPRRLVGSVQDITEQRRAEQEIAAHVAVAEGIAEWQGLEPSAQRLLRRLAGALDCVGGVLWVPEDDHLVARVIWPDPSTPLSTYWTATRRTRLAPGVCAPGVAWERGEPQMVNRGTKTDFGPRWRAAQKDGLRGTVVIPAISGADVVAIVELPFRDDAQITDRLLRTLTGIAHELGQFFGRRRGELGAANLTARELEVLHLASQGRTTRATAEALFVSPATVKTHLAHIYAKLGATDRASAVAIALRLGLIR